MNRYLEEACQREDLASQLKEMKEKHKVAKVRFKDSRRKDIRRYHHQKTDRATGKKRTNFEKPNCSYCGRNDHRPEKNCPAFGSSGGSVTDIITLEYLVWENLSGRKNLNKKKIHTGRNTTTGEVQTKRWWGEQKKTRMQIKKKRTVLDF